jgi:hypothetical protein
LAWPDHAFFFPVKSIIAVIAAAFIDSLCLFFKTRKFKLTESSLITGLIVGFVLSSDAGTGFFAAVAGLAILSKFLVRFKGKHIFNPAAAGIFLAIVLFKQATQWHGAYSWYIIIPAGFYFTWRIRKLPIVGAYFLAYVIMYGVRAYWLKTPFLDQIVYANYFFIFIMLIEPKTSPFDFKEGAAFGIVVSMVSFILYAAGFPYDADLPALLAGNLAFALWNGRPRKTLTK